jgi:pimeloyl-ACP methyl ester carboxylesterase
MINTQDTDRILAWRESGSGDVILFIHAFPLDSSMWEAQLGSVPEGWRAIAPDLPGFGESAVLRGVSSIDTYADAVARVLSVAGVRSAVVCGLSMGGYVALSLLRRHPGMVRALVLCDTRAEADTAETRLERLGQVKRIRSEGMDCVVESMLPKLITRVTRLQNPELVAQLDAQIRQTSPDAAAMAITAMAHRKDATPVLRNIAIPTLVVVGAEDEVTKPGESQLLARSIRGARIEVIEGAGHLSNIEQPETFNTVLRAFLAALPSPPVLSSDRA